MVKRKKYIYDSGGFGETIIFLHGFLSSKNYWNRLLPLFDRQSFRLVSLDLLGFGKAPRPKGCSYTYDEHLAHVNGSLAEIIPDKSITLIGHSMGALLATKWAISHPKRIKTLILINPPIYKNSREVRETLRSTGRVYRLILDSKYRHMVWILLRNIKVVPTHDRHSREMSLKNIIESAELLSDLGSVKCRTLIITGLRDRGVYRHNIREHIFGDNIKLVYGDVDHHSARKNASFIHSQILEFIS